MSETNCEKVMFSVLAKADGEVPDISESEIERHLSDCTLCKAELTLQIPVIELMQKQERRTYDDRLWAGVHHRIEQLESQSERSKPFFFASIISVLVIYKLVEMLPSQDIGIMYKLLPIVVVGLLFYRFGENPLKFETNLTLVGQNYD